jgi:hypothetical protein
MRSDIQRIIHTKFFLQNEAENQPSFPPEFRNTYSSTFIEVQISDRERKFWIMKILPLNTIISVKRLLPNV